MDPLSISTTCLSLIGTITKLSLLVSGFVRDVRAARSDLDAVSRELLSLKTVLELLADDIAGPNNESFPETLKKQIAGIVTNCSGVVAEIEQTLNKHEGARLGKAAKWVTSGKDDVAKLRLSLEAHKSALDIALDMVTLTMAREIKADTNEIRNDTAAIKLDTAQILADIARLQEQLPPDASRHNTSGFMLDRYLDNLTSYAETVCDTIPLDVEEPSIDKNEFGEPEMTRRRNSDSVFKLGSDYAGAAITNNDSGPRLNSLPQSEPPPKVLYANNDRNSPEAENTLSQAQVQKSYPHQLFGSPTSFDLPVRSQNPGPEENSREQPYDSSIRASSQTLVKVKEVDLFKGNLVLDCPVSERILNKVPHAAPPGRDEFSHIRYTALNCKPFEFNTSNFVLRPSLFAKPRRTEIFIAISLGKHTDIATKQSIAFARTMKSVIQTIEYLEIQGRDKFWGGNSWKNIVVGIVSNSHVYESTLSVLEDMGIYWRWDGQALFDDGTTFKHNPVINGKPVRAGLYEYTSQFNLHVDRLNVDVIRGSVPVQTVLCLQEQNFPGLSYPWIKCFAEFLYPCLCIKVEAGAMVYPKAIYKKWDALNKAGQSYTHPVEITPYKDRLQGLRKFLR